MSYIGNTNTTQAFAPAVDFFNGNGSTVAFTLSQPVASVAQVQAVISNVPQKPGDAFTVSGNTITFTSAPPSGTNNIYVYYTSPITQVIAPGQGTVGTTALVDGSVTTAKLSGTTGTGAVALASLPSFTTSIGIGGVAATTSGSGITFPPTSIAHSSTNANTLDDYEEGVFTPAITGAGTAGVGSYSLQVGAYRKIGSLVYVQIALSWGSHTGSGAMQITGLPFSASAGSSVGYGWLNGYSYNISLTASNILQGCEVASNLSFATFYQGPTGGGVTNFVPLDTSAAIEFSGCYIAA